jgi:hypothetical protein
MRQSLLSVSPHMYIRPFGGALDREMYAKQISIIKLTNLFNDENRTFMVHLATPHMSAALLRAPLYSGNCFGKRYVDVILTSIRVLQREGTRGPPIFWRHKTRID